MNLFIWLGAAAPIGILFGAMSILHMKTERAALLGVVCSAAAALMVGRASTSIVGMDLEKGAFSALNILIVIWPAIFLYEILEHAGIFRCMKGMIRNKTADQLMMILLICWLFSSFLQGITGFGVPVAVCAPLLIAVGVRPVWAVMLTLLGHAWANTYGTFALAYDALLAQSETCAIAEMKFFAGFFLWGVNLAGALLICWFYGKWKAVRHMLPFVLVISAVHGGGQLLFSFWNSTIAAFLPTTLALIAGWLILTAGFYTKPWKTKSRLVTDEKNEVPGTEKGSFYAVFPFGLLAAVSAGILLIKPVHGVLNRAVIALSFPQVRTGRGFVVEAADSYGAIHILTHAGFVLLITVVITCLVYYRKKLLNKRQFSAILAAAFKKLIPTSLGILFLVMMAQVLKGSGLMEMIAKGVTLAAGDGYGFSVPFLGLLGAFVTSSNTSSNILLGSFQKSAANLIGVSEAAVLAGQTTGGAIGTVVGPSTILLGTTTAGCKGQEGDVLKFMLPIVLVEAALTGIAVFWVM